jgi:excisionase family DNA binding protein
MFPLESWHRTCQFKRRMLSNAGATARAERSFLIDDAARLLGVSRRTVYYRIREGRLLTIRARCGRSACFCRPWRR